jgi:predicted esterase
VRRNVTSLGMVGALVAGGGRCDAQIDKIKSTPLTVRPHELATGTRTSKAGEYLLDSLKGYAVYVPEQCVGTRRCPLVVFPHPAAATSKYVVKWWRPVSDKYGMILLAPTAVKAGGGRPGQQAGADRLEPDSLDPYRHMEWGPDDQKNIDTALEQVLRKFAIDPDKIALIGYSGSGYVLRQFGRVSLDVFSRIIATSTGDCFSVGVDPQNKTTEFLLVSGSGGEFRHVLENAVALRREGHPLKEVMGFRGHGMEANDYDFLGHWLQESWTTPDPAARPAPSVVVGDSVPLLTTDIVAKMATFWTRFRQEPDSIRRTARLAHLREVVVPVAEERPSVVMTDMPALAATYPSVAADLEAAGLTAQQHEAYRVALLSANVGWWASADVKSLPGGVIGSLVSQAPPISIEATSVQGKNIEFMHRMYLGQDPQFLALAATHMWSTP